MCKRWCGTLRELLVEIFNKDGENINDNKDFCRAFSYKKEELLKAQWKIFINST